MVLRAIRGPELKPEVLRVLRAQELCALRLKRGDELVTAGLEPHDLLDVCDFVKTTLKPKALAKLEAKYDPSRISQRRKLIDALGKFADKHRGTYAGEQAQKKLRR